MHKTCGSALTIFSASFIERLAPVEKSRCLRVFGWTFDLRVLAIVAMICTASAFSAETPAKNDYSLRIVQISDTQPEPDKELHWQHTAESIDLVNGLEPDLVIFPGDITHAGSEPEYARMKALVDKIKAPVHLVPGNHDNIVWLNDAEAALPYAERHRQKTELYKKSFGDVAWSIEFGDFQFIGFDSGEPSGVAWPSISKDRRTWLMETSRKSSKPYKFLVTHYQIDTWSYSRDPDPDSHISEALTAVGILGHMHGHTHRVEARQDVDTGRLVFNSGTTSHRLHDAQPEFQLDGSQRGVMYFDIYDHAMVAFWKPVKGPVRPLGFFDLKESLAAVKRRATRTSK